MKHVVIITTGGTIAMSEDSITHSVIPSRDNPILNTISKINPNLNVEVVDYLNLPSPHITPDIMLDLSKEVNKYLENENIHGVVITHGTDTLEETAYFLDLTVHSDKPVILTGAMRSSNELGADGPINLMNSLKVAYSEDAKNKGVLVVFNDEIHAARFVTKTHTSNVATFQSPQSGSIGTVTKKGVFFQHSPFSRETYFAKKIENNIGLIKAAAGMDNLLIDAMIQYNIKGIVIEALGQGNLPPMMLPGIKKATSLNIPIILVSRCINGIVEDIYGYEGGGKNLKELGVIFSNGLNGQKARIKLMITLPLVSSFNQLREIFEK